MQSIIAARNNTVSHCILPIFAKFHPSALQSAGRVSIIMPLGLVAQSVEQRIENPCVGGSIPPRATKNIQKPPSGGFFVAEPTNSIRPISCIFYAEAIERYRASSSILAKPAIR
jgi:hypothetical protein